jgi:hypothetical protein
VVGGIGLVRQRPRSADVIAAEDVEYLVLDGRFLQRLRQGYPRIASTSRYALLLPGACRALTPRWLRNTRRGRAGRGAAATRGAMRACTSRWGSGRARCSG